MLVRRRNPERDRAGVIDSLIMTLGLALLSWVALIAPYLHDDSLSTVAKLVSVAYPLGDILLLAAAIRLAVDSGRRQPAFYLLSSSIVALLVTDFAYGLITLAGDYDGQVCPRRRLDQLLPAVGRRRPAPVDARPRAARARPRAAAHADPARAAYVRVADRAGDRDDQEVGRRNVDLLVIIAASAVLFGLVVARMAGLVRQQERFMARERTLSAAGAALVAATTREEIYAARRVAVGARRCSTSRPRSVTRRVDDAASRPLGPEALVLELAAQGARVRAARRSRAARRRR